MKLNIAYKHFRQEWHKFWRAQNNQQGVFPPFMFGLLLGVGLFSTISLKTAEKQIAELEATRGDRMQAEREDLAKGLEFAIMTETKATYSDDLTLERARQNSALSTGKTLGKQDFQFIERRTDDALGASQKRVLIANTDDTLLQAELEESADARDLANFNNKGRAGVTLFDSSAVRFRQVENNKKTMEVMAESVYRFYAGNLRFPTLDEYELLAERLNLKDSWGDPFLYTRVTDTHGTLEFTTPWGHRQTIDMKLR